MQNDTSRDVPRAWDGEDYRPLKQRLQDDTHDRARLSLLSTAQTLQQDLKQWYRQYISIEDGLRTPTLKHAPATSNTYPFDAIYVYRDVVSASMIVTYHAYLIVLNRVIDSLLSDSSYSGENLELARAICMSVDYCSHAGFCGTQTMKFSLPIAHSALPVKYHVWTTAWIEKFSGNLEATTIQPMRS